ncbi:MAG: hypothetical protein ACO24H_09150 [Polynucleobacter sp.]|jgi:putative ubiquitin-RnfH superfamily antitoxin RatB of RatAB toxin-antitoxin module
MGNRKRRTDIKVNVCYELNDKTKCMTLRNQEAYALKTAIENEGGVVWWFVPVD